MGCRFSKQQRAPGPGRHNWFEPSTQPEGMHAADSRLSPRIFHAADIEPTIATPSRSVPRVRSDISCRGTHLHSWSHRYCRSLCDHNVRFFPQIRGGCRMNSRESSIRTCQLGPNRWNRSPRAWACVSCVSEDVLPASDPHLYGFEGSGNAVEKRSHHKDFLSAGAH